MFINQQTDDDFEEHPVRRLYEEGMKDDDFIAQRFFFTYIWIGISCVV